MSYYSRVERVARPHARPQALDRVILLVPEPEPHDVQHVGGGLPRCSAVRLPCSSFLVESESETGLDGLVRALTGVRRRAKRGAAACCGRRRIVQAASRRARRLAGGEEASRARRPTAALTVERREELE